MPQIAFGAQSYQHTSRPLSAQRMINALLEPAPPAAKTPAAVVPCFGIKDYLTIGTGPMRGGLRVNQTIYVVSGAKLYKLSMSGAVTELGSVPGSGPVFMDSDGSQVLITVNGPSYLYDGATVTPMADPDFPGAEWTTFLDGYAIIGPGDGRVYVNHTPFDFSAWDALDFASAEASPDDIVVGITDHREVFLFGRDSTEVWYDSGDAAFPLTRTASGYMEIGCVSKYGPAKIDNSIFFPASDGTIRRVNGYTPVRISTTAIEQAITNFSSQECVGQAWIENGHSMYGLTYAEGTFVYDISTELWHERRSYGQQNWRAAFMVRGDNTTLVGDSQSNRLGILSPDVFTEWDQPLISSVTAPAIAKGNDPIWHSSLELVFDNGVGLSTGQGSDPKVMLDWSDDGGRTFGVELWRSLGKQGDFKSTARWNRLGQSRDRVYRYSVSDPIRRTLIQALWNDAA
jgi:glutamine cyclotransferase